jgi:hypothetical protein
MDGSGLSLISGSTSKIAGGLGKILNQYSRCPGLDSNRVHPEYVKGVIARVSLLIREIT